MKNTKVVLALLMALVICCLCAVSLADTESGDYQYKLDSDGVATITKYSG